LANVRANLKKKFDEIASKEAETKAIALAEMKAKMKAKLD